MTEEEIKAIVVICTKNIIFAICFTILAVVFQKWWISLFSLLFYTTYSKKGDKE